LGHGSEGVEDHGQLGRGAPASSGYVVFRCRLLASECLSAAFTLDQYADAVPQQLEEAGEKVSTRLLEASGCIFLPEAKRRQSEVRK
jgi:hypothetical protein